MNAAIENVSIHTVEDLEGKIPGYRVTDFLAQGGMGAVYIGVQEKLDRQVAIKILPPELTKDKTFNDAFRTEARAMAKVSHSNLVGIFDFGEVDDFLYIVMEFVEGRTLIDVTNGVAVEQNEAAELIIGLCNGLHKAHEAGIIHRDIKPGNILIDDSGVPKLVDFGLARPTEDIEEGEIFGTPGYTAPEVLQNPRAVDRASDIFSVGVLFFELMTGGLPSRPGIVPSDVSNADPIFDTIVKKATNPIKNMRYETAKDLMKALQSALNVVDGTAPSLVDTSTARVGLNTATAAHSITPVSATTGSTLTAAPLSPDRGRQATLLSANTGTNTRAPQALSAGTQAVSLGAQAQRSTTIYQTKKPSSISFSHIIVIVLLLAGLGYGWKIVQDRNSAQELSVKDKQAAPEQPVKDTKSVDKKKKPKKTVAKTSVGPSNQAGKNKPKALPANNGNIAIDITSSATENPASVTFFDTEINLNSDKSPNSEVDNADNGTKKNTSTSKKKPRSNKKSKERSTPRSR